VGKWRERSGKVVEWSWCCWLKEPDVVDEKKLKLGIGSVGDR
jgi:hypothetical protein